jgi:chromate transport protein ChrA
MHKRKASVLLTCLGFLFSVGLPLAATLSFFPLWRTRGGTAALAGGTLLLIALCALPLWRTVKALLRSPSVWELWLFAFFAFLLVKSIIIEMCVICFFGLIGNLIGSLLFFLARRKRGGGDGA